MAVGSNRLVPLTKGGFSPATWPPRATSVMFPSVWRGRVEKRVGEDYGADQEQNDRQAVFPKGMLQASRAAFGREDVLAADAPIVIGRRYEAKNPSNSQHHTKRNRAECARSLRYFSKNSPGPRWVSANLERQVYIDRLRSQTFLIVTSLVPQFRRRHVRPIRSIRGHLELCLNIESAGINGERLLRKRGLDLLGLGKIDTLHLQRTRPGQLQGN